MSLHERLFDCPHCKGKCQFIPLTKGLAKCSADNMYHSAWTCSNCYGFILALTQNSSSGEFDNILPSYKRKPILKAEKLPKKILYNYVESLITYSNDCYVSTVIMCRRCIQIACIENNATGNNLLKQIDSMSIDDSLKKLAHKIRYWGNSGAHPDILLDEEIEEDDASTALDFVEKFLDFVYIIPADLKQIEDKVGKNQE